MNHKAEFHKASKPKAPSPFCVRLSDEEKARLRTEAGGRPLGAYVRDRLFGEAAQKRRVSRKPKVDDEALGRVLAALGQSRLSSNLNQIAKGVNTGTLLLTPDVEADVREACDAVAAMRRDLLKALGLQTDPPSSEGLRRGERRPR